MFFTKMPKIEYDFLGTGKGTKIPNIFRQIRVDSQQFDKITAYEYYTVKDMRPDQVSYELYGTTEHHWTFFLINKHLQGGMNSWPMSYQTLERHLDVKYPGHTLRPFRDENDDLDFNMVSSRFDVGDIVYVAGDNSSAPTGPYGYLTERDTIHNQLHFTYADDSPGEFRLGDDIRIGPFYVDESVKVNQSDPKEKYRLSTRRQSVHHFETSDGVSYTNYENYNRPLDVVTIDDYEKQANEDRGKIRVIRKRYIDEFAIKYRQLVNG
jgi:hypothetical protein